MISALHVSKVYPKQPWGSGPAQALRDITFDVTPGEMVAYIGANGAGKSTTIKCILGIVRPSGGRLLVRGNDPVKMRVQNAWKTGVMMGQRTNLWWDLSVLDSYELLRRIYAVPRAEYHPWLADIVEMLDLGGVLNRLTRDLSLGQRVRADIGACILHKPDLLVLDEPTIGLDLLTQRKVQNCLMEVHGRFRTTLFMASNNLADVEALCDRTVVVADGNILLDRSLRELHARYANIRIVHVEPNDVSGAAIPRDLELIRQSTHYVEYAFDEGRASQKQVINMLTTRGPIENVSFRRLELGEIVERLWRKETDGTGN